MRCTNVIPLQRLVNLDQLDARNLQRVLSIRQTNTTFASWQYVYGTNKHTNFMDLAFVTSNTIMDLENKWCKFTTPINTLHYTPRYFIRKITYVLM